VLPPQFDVWRHNAGLINGWCVQISTWPPVRRKCKDVPTPGQRRIQSGFRWRGSPGRRFSLQRVYTGTRFTGDRLKSSLLRLQQSPTRRPFPDVLQWKDEMWVSDVWGWHDHLAKIVWIVSIIVQQGRRVEWRKISGGSQWKNTGYACSNPNGLGMSLSRVGEILLQSLPGLGWAQRS